MSDRVVFQTSDQVALVGTFLAPSKPKGVILLLHMMPEDRTSWAKLQASLKEQGMASLAIDLRGHGESLHQGTRLLDYRGFRDVDHQSSIEDVRSSVQWLTNRGFPPDRIGIAGASIGANLALTYAATQPSIRLLVLFSPGADYHGIKTLDAVSRLSPSQTILLLASQGDDQESFDDAKRLLEKAPSERKAMKPYTAGGHGTLLLKTDPALADELASWIAGQFA